MTIAARMLPEFDHEMRTTRSLLERVPDDRAGFTPHAKSMAMGSLAIHLYGLVTWMPVIFSGTELDVTGPVAKALTPEWRSAAATLESFDRAVDEARRTLAAVDDEAMRAPWTLRAGSHVLFTMPRAGVVRTMVLNHIIHHRGQLSVYLRLNDIPLPDIYGPTADSVR